MWQFASSFHDGMFVLDAVGESKKLTSLIDFEEEAIRTWAEYMLRHGKVVSPLSGEETNQTKVQTVGYVLWGSLKSVAYQYEEAAIKNFPRALKISAQRFRELRESFSQFLEVWEKGGVLLKVIIEESRIVQEVEHTPLKKDEVLKQFDEIAERLVK